MVVLDVDKYPQYADIVNKVNSILSSFHRVSRKDRIDFLTGKAIGILSSARDFGMISDRQYSYMAHSVYISQSAALINLEENNK